MVGFLPGLLLAGCGVLDDAGIIDPDNDTAGVVEIPEGEYCDRVADWDPGWAAFEAEVLRLVNVERANGGECTGQSASGPVRRSFPASAPLMQNGYLRCAARNHALDMAANRYFSHDQPQTGETPSGRITRTGYLWSAVGENIAVGQSSPAQVVSDWMGSYPHCTNILEPSFVELGVGFFDAEQPHEGNIPGLYWTQNFGTPR